MVLVKGRLLSTMRHMVLFACTCFGAKVRARLSSPLSDRRNAMSENGSRRQLSCALLHVHNSDTIMVRKNTQHESSYADTRPVSVVSSTDTEDDDDDCRKRLTPAKRKRPHIPSLSHRPPSATEPPGTYLLDESAHAWLRSELASVGRSDVPLWPSIAIVPDGQLPMRGCRCLYDTYLRGYFSMRPGSESVTHRGIVVVLSLVKPHKSYTRCFSTTILEFLTMFTAVKPVVLEMQIKKRPGTITDHRAKWAAVAAVADAANPTPLGVDVAGVRVSHPPIDNVDVPRPAAPHSPDRDVPLPVAPHVHIEHPPDTLRETAPDPTDAPHQCARQSYEEMMDDVADRTNQPMFHESWRMQVFVRWYNENAGIVRARLRHAPTCVSPDAHRSVVFLAFCFAAVAFCNGAQSMSASSGSGATRLCGV